MMYIYINQIKSPLKKTHTHTHLISSLHVFEVLAKSIKGLLLELLWCVDSVPITLIPNHILTTIHRYISNEYTISELGSGIGRSAILMHLYSGQNVIGYERNRHRVNASEQLKKKVFNALRKDFKNMLGLNEMCFNFFRKQILFDLCR